MAQTDRPLRVFLCHASQDKSTVRELAQRLKAEGWIDPWLDEDKLLLGQHWAAAIEDALYEADNVIIFLSRNSVQKEGFVQRELNYAWDISLEKPRDVIFLIPFRLDDVGIPRHLASRQWGDYFGGKKENTYQTLLRSLKARHTQKLAQETEEHARAEAEEADTYKQAAGANREQVNSAPEEKVRPLQEVIADKRDKVEARVGEPFGLKRIRIPQLGRSVDLNTKNQDDKNSKVSLREYIREIDVLIARGDSRFAFAHCERILNDFPNCLDVYRLLGKALLEFKQPAEAEKAFLEIIGVAPGDFVAHMGISMIRESQGKLDDSIWHMERAFDVWASNGAVQSELQRLYELRDGIRPPKIRMTRGALANMYLQGELYPQAIAEAKRVLQEDPSRRDLQVLLMKAYFKSGLQTDAEKLALTINKQYPLCLDANCILASILVVSDGDSAQVYWRRVIQLDPYAKYVSFPNDSLFDSSKVPDEMIALQRLS